MKRTPSPPLISKQTPLRQNASKVTIAQPEVASTQNYHESHDNTDLEAV